MRTRQQIAAALDFAVLRPPVSLQTVRDACTTAMAEGIHSVTVPPVYIRPARFLLEGSGVKAGTTIGFPFGQNMFKMGEIEYAINNGAESATLVVDYSQYIDGNPWVVFEEMRALSRICAERNIESKVIVEACFLDAALVREIVRIAGKAGVNYIKTSSGFASGGGATLTAISRLVDALAAHGISMGVEASGGISTPEQADAFLNAGATLIGTSNWSVLPVS